MAKSPEVTLLVERINALRHKDPGQAADAARTSWKALDRFKLHTDPSIAEANDEFSYAESVARRSAIKKSIFLPSVVHHIREGINTLWENGPLSETEEDARSRGNIWDQSFHGLEIQEIVLQEIYYLLELLKTIDSNAELNVFYTAVVKMLATLQEEYGKDRFSEIFVIKTVSDIALIKEAYAQYLARLATETWTQNEETAYIHTQVLTKSFARDWSVFKMARENLNLSRKDAIVLSLKEKTKGIGQKLFRVGWKVQNAIARVGGFDVHNATEVGKLLKQRQMGLGEDRVRPLL